MQAELKAEWVKALRSGEYKQGFGKLRKCDYGGHSYHCGLGVLGDVLVKKGAAMWGKHGRLEYKGISRVSALPSELRQDIKLFGPLHDRTVFLNDVARNTFPEIADWIETNIPGEDTPTV